MPGPGLVLGAGEGEVVHPSVDAHGDDAEGLAHQVGLGVADEDVEEPLHLEAVHFDVVVQAGLAEQMVADPAAHQVGLPAGLVDLPGDFQEAGREDVLGDLHHGAEESAGVNRCSAPSTKAESFSSAALTFPRHSSSSCMAKRSWSAERSP